ncbi:aminopeptidase [Diplodia seriata]|uniref:Xaa-Pro aminopeptidase n=1 Tax=Diplodia seriata TaxID=420778 RepID=A0A0G2EDQ2_9PEZI|nr:putative xaa-pro dipeptidase app [Diplodia seriata]
MFRSSLRVLHAAARAQGPRAVRRAFHQAPVRRQLVSAAELQFGQPLHETHPHLLQPGEGKQPPLTPGITALEYAQRRDALAKAMLPNSVAILAGSDTKFRSGAVFYEFHQDPDFFYLTGFNEPEALALIEKTGPGDDYIFRLYVRPKDVRAEMWDGARSGIQAALDVFNADEAGDIKDIGKNIPAILRRNQHIYTDLPRNLDHRSAITRYLSGTMYTGDNGFPKALQSVKPSAVKPLRPIMNELRMYKSEAEIRNMRKAGQASARTFTHAMKNDFSTERELHAHMDFGFKMMGCDGVAYIPVVAGGKNGLSIHYVRNDNVLNNGEMVLVDAGGEYGGYITDITRTWPINGRFTAAQKDLYEVVLKVQRSCVSLCREDARLSLDKLHNIACESLRDGLKHLGFNMSGHALETLFPHHLGHYIGLDVHDSPGFPRNKILQTGQCITVEPGIYVPDDERWPAPFRGMAIRIEDSVCVQPESPLILTTEAVKEIVDIENLERAR